jgi:hypothetical protein
VHTLTYAEVPDHRRHVRNARHCGGRPLRPTNLHRRISADGPGRSHDPGTCIDRCGPRPRSAAGAAATPAHGRRPRTNAHGGQVIGSRSGPRRVAPAGDVGHLRALSEFATTTIDFGVAERGCLAPVRTNVVVDDQYPNHIVLSPA